MMKKGRSIAKDSLLLTAVRCITMVGGIIQAMVLARILTKEVYGTYSEALLLISFFTPLFSLGLSDALNYFFNKEKDSNSNKYFINTIFFLSLVSGIVGGIGLLFSTNIISNYYKNGAIVSLMVYVAFRPCTQNLIALYQPLYISSGFSNIIALRNLLFSISSFLIVTIVTLMTSNILWVLFLLLVLDIIQILFFHIYYVKNKFIINPFKIKKSLIKRILKYALPMLLALSVGTININLDSLVISNLMSVSDFALYSNMAKELPFNFIVTSFTAVVSPKIVKLVNNNEKNEEFKSLWSNYIKIGYILTWPLCVGAILLSPQIITILYSTKYLSNIGIIIFRIYLVVSMLRFTYFGMVPSAKGETKIILYYAIFGMIVNMIFNYLLFYLLGMVGPPIATVISQIVMLALYFRKSISLVNCNLRDIIDFKELFTFGLEILLCCVLTILVTRFLFNLIQNVILQCVLGYMVFLGTIYFIKMKDIKKILGELNAC